MSKTTPLISFTKTAFSYYQKSQSSKIENLKKDSGRKNLKNTYVEDQRISVTGSDPLGNSGKKLSTSNNDSLFKSLIIRP
jgi:hypothetical protein